MSPTTTPRPLSRSETTRVSRAVAAVPVTPSTKGEPRDRGTIAWRVFVGLVLVAIVATVVFTRQGTSAEDERTRLLNLIDTECGPGGASVGQPLCVATAPQRAEDTSQAASDVGVDAARVIEIVRAELSSNPAKDGRSPTAAELTGLIRGVLTANPDLYEAKQGEQGEPGKQGVPGETGPGPSDAQVEAAFAAVAAANPEAFKGKDGIDGQSPPCLAEPGQCKGEDGKPPVQITQRFPDGSTSVCTRDGGSPDSSPTYTCPVPTGATTNPDPPSTTDPPVPDPDPEPDPGPGDGGLLGGG